MIFSYRRCAQAAIRLRGPGYRRAFFLHCAAVALLCAGSVSAPQPAGAASAPAVQAPLLANTPNIDGRIDASWADAKQVSLDFDYNYRRRAVQPAVVYVAQDSKAIDVAFVVKQRERPRTTQLVNGSGIENDDYVGVYLFPDGPRGFQYSFESNASGARFQTSTENSDYSPQWQAAGRITDDGYVVTMRIPINVIRRSGGSRWAAQFARRSVATNELAVWSYSPEASSYLDPAFSGTLDGVGGVARAGVARHLARAQIYALNDITTPLNGGSTSRFGGDLSVPITPTASFLATLHPDYSNVETDQQTITPSAYPRRYSEVRPFFTQQSAFNSLYACDRCPTTLYTPAIPAFSRGYAVEGTQGPVSFDAFSTAASGRLDNAEVVSYTNNTRVHQQLLSIQSVAVNAPGFHDEVNTVTAGYQDVKSHLFGYVNYGEDHGTNVANPGAAKYSEIGAGYQSATAWFGADLQSTGAQFAPADGYVAQSDLHGYGLSGSKRWKFTPSSAVRDVSLQTSYARFWNHLGELANASSNAAVNANLKNQVTIGIGMGTQDVRTYAGDLLPFGTVDVVAGYGFATSTPSYVAHSGGRYYHGHLDAWSYFTRQRILPRVHVTLEAYENEYQSLYPGEQSVRQWLERASFNWQLNRFSSIDIGARKIVGSDVPNAYSAPQFAPYTGGNISAAFHFLAAKNEFYVVYGDPNSFSTTPRIVVKWIRYVGADKGT